jgi:G3E family GTPase
MDKTVDVYILSGFLGSGKTTLLKRLLAEAKNRGLRPAVLMNEVGEVNLDGLAVDASVPMAEMLGGCICCTIKADVGLELLNLVNRHRPDVVFVESTGVAQPLEIVDAVSDVSMYAKIELRGVITVVDSAHLLDRVRVGSGKTLKLMRDQIRVSSWLLLNKIDRIGEAELQELTEALRGWNPRAELHPTIRCDADLSSIWSLPSPADGDRGHRGDAASDRGNPHAHHHDHDHVNVVTYYIPRPLDSEAFEAFLRELPEGVYRAKGIVSFSDTASRFLFQYAYRESDFMRITPQKTVQDVAVFIGEGFSRTDLLNRLERLSAAAG